MGIESDQLVYDYLSRVGDLAQRQQLPSGTRMRLVSSLRSEIDRQRAGFGSDSAASVRRILGRLGTPDEVVAAASEDGGASASHVPRPAPKPALPQQRVRRRIPKPRRSAAPEQADVPRMTTGASPPHLAGMDELGPSGSEPDWWRIEPGPFGAGESVAGFTGGVEIPEILKPPPSEEESEEQDEHEEEHEDGEYEDDDAVEAEPEPRRWRPRLRRRTGEGEAVVAPAFASPFLLLAAALLVGGAVLGSWLALGSGWLLAYASRRLSRTEAKWAVVGLPGAVAVGGLVWLWGRVNERWGEPVPEDGMRDALTGTWPWVVKGAAVASALYLVWRARRR
ncbi:hypothetical protein HRW23_13020 [Streptomyces lunaelactis]|uniref:hypothetical protein n=1 Tax=Streptomyces lunaelactis TaxID=1535768 RepID=UPI001584C1E2|nr:hypothetical protein [Streptomyces lunaelactis]NUK52663.1 hypothetical protein [Streptomyces lunaelactis]NUK68936.1 hypothetical protein [Streptomyces lunaelactis]NUK73715.1 hypothetical protein [Streptomyces lunaelactis]NUK78293.1 hypothetical protein [Streptomyces lunaelactis]